MTARFRYDATLTAAFPAIRGAVISLRGVTNTPSPDGLRAVYDAEQVQVKDRLASTPIAEHQSIAAWRRTFSALGVKPTQYRVAAEALLRRLDKVGDIPSINALVDIGNLVSIRHALPVAVFDQRHVTGGTTVREAEGTERFTDLGAAEAVNPPAGEVVFVDDAGLVSARRWCWRQSDQSATQLDSTDVLVTIEGLHDAAEDDVFSAADTFLELAEAHVPGFDSDVWLLDAITSATE